MFGKIFKLLLILKILVMLKIRELFDKYYKEYKVR